MEVCITVLNYDGKYQNQIHQLKYMLFSTKIAVNLQKLAKITEILLKLHVNCTKLCLKFFFN